MKQINIIEEWSEKDVNFAKSIAFEVGFRRQHVLNTTSDLPALYAENLDGDRIQIIKTQEFGFMVMRDLKDCGLYGMDADQQKL